MLPVNTLYLFGSAARGKQGPLSDFDFAFQAKSGLNPKKRFALKLNVRDRMSRALKTNDIDIVDLEEAPPLLVHRILKDGKILYCASPRHRVRFEFARLTEYLDFQTFFREGNEDRRLPTTPRSRCHQERT